MSEMMWYAQRGAIEAAWREVYEDQKAAAAAKAQGKQLWEIEYEQWLTERDAKETSE